MADVAGCGAHDAAARASSPAQSREDISTITSRRPVARAPCLTGGADPINNAEQVVVSLLPRRPLALGAALVALLGHTAGAEPLSRADARLKDDLTVVQAFRPAYRFWQHIFTIPDGRIAFGSEQDGRLLATFPTKGDWGRDALWDKTLAATLNGVVWPAKLDDRRDLVVRQLTPATGPLLHNPTRGLFLLPNIPKYAPFLDEWSRIYERFGVPAEIGLSQAILESGLNGVAKSRASALGLCQWLRRNWQTLDRLSPAVIEAFNQTTQAPYCAAYLSILGTMPAASSRRSRNTTPAASTSGARSSTASASAAPPCPSSNSAARSSRATCASRSARLPRSLPHLRHPLVPLRRDGFGNTLTVRQLRARCRREDLRDAHEPGGAGRRDYERDQSAVSEVQRFNPALKRAGRRRHDLPAAAGARARRRRHVLAARSIAGVHRRPRRLPPARTGRARWHDASFEPVLQGYRKRFAATDTEEGDVMASVLAYVIGDLRTSRRAAILDEFRTSGEILQLFRQGAAELGHILTGSQ
jgi:hypothetical protein